MESKKEIKTTCKEISLVKDYTADELAKYVNDDEKIEKVYQDKKHKCMVAVVNWTPNDFVDKEDFPTVQKQRKVRFNNYGSEFNDNFAQWQIGVIARKGSEACDTIEEFYKTNNLNSDILYFVKTRGINEYYRRQDKLEKLLQQQQKQ